MLKNIQIAALFIMALVVSEVSLWLFWSNDIGAFSYIFSVLIGYASLLSILFFGDKITWLGKALKVIWNLTLSNYPKALSTFLVITVACFILGFALHNKWEAIKFNTIFEINSKKNSIPLESTMQMENIHTQETYVSVIEHNGRGRFRTDKDSVVQVLVSLGTTHYIFQPLTVDKIPFYKALDLENAEVLKKTPSLKTAQSSIASFNMPQSYFRQFNTGHDQSSRNLKYDQHVKYGLPSNIGLVEKKGYIFSYNKVLRIPNWAAYWITGEPMNIERPGRFIQEPLIDDSIQASVNDYRGSGYDRGHLVSISDMKYLGKQEVEEASSMATIVPQSRFLNRKTWLELEKLGRMHAENGVGIIAGPVFSGNNNKVQLITIGDNDVGVPTHMFRIIYRIKSDSSIETLSFIVPNSDDVSKDITEYMVSIDEIEKWTGLDFFNELEPLTEEKMEKVIPNALW